MVEGLAEKNVGEKAEASRVAIVPSVPYPSVCRTQGERCEGEMWILPRWVVAREKQDDLLVAVRTARSRTGDGKSAARIDDDVVES